MDSTNNTAASAGVLPSPTAAASTAAAAQVPVMDAIMSIGSGVDATFLAQFIDATPDTAGAKLDLLMKKLNRPTGPELMGGPWVKRTVRCFVAALLKHLSLVGAARKYVQQHEQTLLAKAAPSLSSSSSAAVSQLVDAFKKGGLMHRWIISQRQSMQQLHVARMQQLESEGKRMTQEQIDATEKRLEYEGFCSSLFNKALYLLSVRPCLTHSASRGSHLAATPGLKLASEVSSTLAMTRTLSNEVQLVRSNSSGGRAREGAESFLSLFSVYKTLQHFALYRQRKEREKGEGDAKTDDNIVDLLGAVRAARHAGVHLHLPHRRAVAPRSAAPVGHRSRPVSAAVAALHHGPHRSAGQLLQPLPRVQRLSQRRTPGGWPRRPALLLEDRVVRLPPAQARAHRLLALYRTLASYIKDEQLVTPMRALALDAWAIEWIPLDHPELIDVDILHALHQLTGHSGAQHPQGVLKPLAEHVLKLLLAAQMRFDIDSAPVMAAGPHAELSDDEDSGDDDGMDDGTQPRGAAASAAFVNNLKGPIRLDRLQQQIVDRVFTDLYHASQALVRLRQQIAALGLSDTQLEQQPPSSTLAEQYLTAELNAFSALSTLVAISASSAFTLQYLSSRNVLQLLIAILGQGTPRLQRSALSLLGELLKSISPHQLDAMRLRDQAGAKEDSQPITSGSLLTYLFRSIGIATYGDYLSAPSPARAKDDSAGSAAVRQPLRPPHRRGTPVVGCGDDHAHTRVAQAWREGAGGRIGWRASRGGDEDEATGGRRGEGGKARLARALRPRASCVGG